MTVFVAMLRGINVDGRKRIRMDELRDLFRLLHRRDVLTHVQSGNVIFASSVSRAATIAVRIGREIMMRYGFEVAAALRTPGELQVVIDHSLFAHQPGLGPKSLCVIFLQQESREGLAASLHEQRAGTDR